MLQRSFDYDLDLMGEALPLALIPRIAVLKRCQTPTLSTPAAFWLSGCTDGALRVTRDPGAFMFPANYATAPECTLRAQLCVEDLRRHN